MCVCVHKFINPRYLGFKSMMCVCVYMCSLIHDSSGTICSVCLDSGMFDIYMVNGFHE